MRNRRSRRRFAAPPLSTAGLKQKVTTQRAPQTCLSLVVVVGGVDNLSVLL